MNDKKYHDVYLIKYYDLWCPRRYFQGCFNDEEMKEFISCFDGEALDSIYEVDEERMDGHQMKRRWLTKKQVDKQA